MALPDGRVLIFGFVPGYKLPPEEDIARFLANYPTTRDICAIEPGIMLRVSKAFHNALVVPQAIEMGVDSSLVDRHNNEIILDPDFDLDTYNKVKAAIIDALKEGAKTGYRITENTAPLKAEEKNILSYITDFCRSVASKWYLTTSGKVQLVQWKLLAELYKDKKP